MIALTVRLGALRCSQSNSINWIERVVADVEDLAIAPAARFFLLGGWFASAFAGAISAGLIARKPAIAWVPTMLVLLHAFGSTSFGPIPTWLTSAAVAAVLVGVGWPFTLCGMHAEQVGARAGSDQLGPPRSRSC